MSVLVRKCFSSSIRFATGSQVRHGTSIPVILTQSIENRGAAGEVIDVKRGFARNYLIPRKMAVYATFDNKNKLSTAGISSFAPTLNQDLLKSKLSAISQDKLVFTLGTWATGSLVKSITPSHVRRLLEAEGVLLGRTAIIKIDELITKAGKYTIQVDGNDLTIQVLPAPVV